MVVAVAVVAKPVVDKFSMSEEIRAGVSCSRLGRRVDLNFTVVYVSVLNVEMLKEVDIVFQIKRDIFHVFSLSVFGGLLGLIVSV